MIAARILGAGAIDVMFRHILPNVIGPLTVAATLGIASAILTEAGLSFLGLGVVQPTPSWGSMLNDARSPATLAGKPWLCLECHTRASRVGEFAVGDYVWKVKPFAPK